MTKRLTRFLIFLFILLLLALSYLGYTIYLNHTTGFLNVNDQVIYKTRDGEQLFGLQNIDGHTYYFDKKSGYMHKGFIVKNNKQYYFDENGQLAKGLTKINHQYTYFKEDASMSIDEYQTITYHGKKQESYFDENGYMVKGQKEIDGIMEYFDENGKHAFNHVYLQEGIQAIINRYQGVKSIYFKDLKSNASFSFDKDVVLYPCCMIKVSALASVYNEIHQGKLNYYEHQNQIEKMITISDNTAYNELMIAIGNGDGIQGVDIANEFIASLGLSNTHIGHGLRPGYGYFTTHTKNKTNPSDLGLLFEKLYKGEVISKTASEEMIALLKRCEDNDEIKRGLPTEIEYAHKTGCAYALYHDGGIVYTPNRDYILVIFSDQVPNYQQMMSEISKFIYDYISLLPSDHI